MFQVVEGVVDEELEFGYDAQLVAHTGAQFVANLTGVGVDVIQNFLGTLRGEDAEVAAGNAQVGTDAHGTDGDQHAAEGLSFFLKHVAQFFLSETRDFLLSGCFHIYIKEYSQIDFLGIMGQGVV